ncbi:hypothetical protein SDC9_120269 [bioreactor metagenome]|uniref:Uncharacterized protein n=1 Tax=bioreactor metagenome TaxID=1076179 RepID=A0A645C6I7_9ZZZZ
MDLLFGDAACGEKKSDRTGQRKPLLNRLDGWVQIIPGEFPIFHTHVSLSELIHFIQ